MGRVFVGYDEQLDRKVAIKLLRWPGQRDTASARLMREAQALARLSHPNVVQVHEAGAHGDAVYVAMELVDGQTLEEWLGQADHGSRAILDVLVQAGRGLEAAHAAGIVHRDFKPDNVLVGADGRVRVLDFGLARGVDSSEGEPIDDEGAAVSCADVDEVPERRGDADLGEAPERRGDADLGEAPERRVDASPANLLRAPLTQHGAVMGTPAYMAPEQHMGLLCDASADQFAFCVSAFEALFGMLPFDARPLHALAQVKMLGALPAFPRDSRVPRKVRDAILRGLSPEPADRWPQMGPLLDVLERAHKGRRRWLVPSVGAALGLGLVGYDVLRAEPGDAPCSRASAPIERAWSGDQRAASEHGLPPESAIEVLSSLDDWASRWSAAALQSCEDVHVRRVLSAGSLDRRGVCLGRRLATFEVLTQGLAKGEIEQGPALVQWLGQLDDPRECLSEAVLVSEFEAVPAERAQQIAEIRRSLVQLEMGRERRSLSERIHAAEELLTRSEAIGWRPLVGEVSLLLGRLHTAANDGAAARRFLGDAIDISDAAHDVEQQSFAWSAMNQVERLVEFDVKRARWAWERQAAVLDQVEASPRRRALLLKDLGLTQELAGHETEAERSLRDALALLEQGGTSAAWQRAEVLQNLANLLAFTGRASEARTLLDDARTLELGSSTDVRTGMLTPSTTSDRLDEGIVLIQNGELEDAILLLGEVLVAAVEDHGPRSEMVARVHVALAAAHSMLGHVDELRIHAELADHISQETLGPLHPLRGDVLSAVAESALQDGRLAAAIRAFEAALELVQRVRPDDPTAIAMAENNLADVLHQDGQHERADRLVTHALPLLEQGLGGEDPLVDEVRRLASSIREAMASE